MGTLLTDFTLIKAGALHRATGGYLILDARKLLMQAYAWEGLKRTLRARQIHIESLGQLFSTISTISLEPEPIPLNTKVILTGDRELYYLLCAYDPDFRELFKVAADFENEMVRNEANNKAYADLIANLARIRLGKGEVVDIERQVELGGPIHAKGVLILAGFLGARYGVERPFAFSATLVFEQSYSGVEGDSASSAELYALLSALAEVPLKQSLAVTGSVNQRGQVQIIGGVNEKIEGFFDICRARGLTGEQGVLIPAANVLHLMLRQDVVEAAAAGQFHIYPVSTIDEGLGLLTGLPMGELDKFGHYPAESLNGRIINRLDTLAQKVRDFGPLPK